MKHHIDPTVDCVFKKLLGTEENKNLLIHFLNAVIKPPANKKIKYVEILNPYNDKDFFSDKLSVVDVKAKDSENNETFQVDIQLSIHAGLKSRILYYWSDIYSSQLSEGLKYTALKPVISIWILTDQLFDEAGFHFHFKVFDEEHKISLNDDCSIHILELSKFNITEIKDELERWLSFFRYGKDLDDESLPNYMNTQEMRQAMQTLKLFSEKEREYHLYQSRMNYIRLQKTIEDEMEQLKQERDLAIQKEQQALQREKAILEKLKKAGINIENI
ncbi:MAG: Rpn family recombination-promoting nuclease/putative transposase [Desulfobacterales bacterium]|nr:Rpn family recombination-promoting nuclease/putative transposase [Desulfobacterales bacterium]